MHIPRSSRRLAAAALAIFALGAGASLAQEAYPSRPITIVVPYPPGGSNDVFARAIGKRLSEELGQPVVVDNKPGAGGTLGTSIVAKAQPDGYTLAAVSSSFVTNAAVQPKLPFDPVNHLAPVAMMARGPFVVAVRADLPVKTPADLVGLARKQPGKLNYASSGPGSTNQFATELLKNKAHIFLTHIPYRGMGPATNDLMAGTVDLLIASGSSLQAALRSGKARAIAVTGLKPSAAAPGLPPMAEAAPGFEFSIWWGLLAPGGTPAAVVEKLNAAVNRVVQTPEMRQFFLREGAEPAQLSAAEFAAEVRRGIPYWQDVARRAGIQAE